MAEVDDAGAQPFAQEQQVVVGETEAEEVSVSALVANEDAAETSEGDRATGELCPERASSPTCCCRVVGAATILLFDGLLVLALDRAGEVFDLDRLALVSLSLAAVLVLARRWQQLQHLLPLLLATAPVDDDGGCSLTSAINAARDGDESVAFAKEALGGLSAGKRVLRAYCCVPTVLMLGALTLQLTKCDLELRGRELADEPTYADELAKMRNRTTVSSCCCARCSCDSCESSARSGSPLLLDPAAALDLGGTK